MPQLVNTPSKHFPVYLFQLQCVGCVGDSGVARDVPGVRVRRGRVRHGCGLRLRPRAGAGVRGGGLVTESACAQSYFFKLGGTENLSILAVNVLAVNVLAVNSVS